MKTPTALRICVLGLSSCLLLGSFLSCHPRASTPASEVLLVLKTRDNPFFKSIQDGVEAELSKLTPAPSVIVRAGTKEGDVGSQRRLLAEFAEQEAQAPARHSLRGVLLTPSGSNMELVQEIKRFRDLGVPVVLIDTRIASEALAAAGTTYDAFVGSDNKDGGKVAADYILDRVENSARLLLLNGTDGHETAAARRQGFREELQRREAASGSVIDLTERTCNWRRDEARSTVDSMLALGQHFDAIFAANDEMALGALEALRQAGVKPGTVVVVGFDATEEAVEAVREGRLSATLAQNPRGMGAKAVQALEAIWQGRLANRDLVIPTKLVE